MLYKWSDSHNIRHAIYVLFGLRKGQKYRLGKIHYLLNVLHLEIDHTQNVSEY